MALLGGALPLQEALAQAGGPPQQSVDGSANSATDASGPGESNAGFFGLVLPKTYRLAPISWRGSIADEFDQQTNENSVTQSHRQTLSLYANSFVLHPAILSLNGNVNWSTGTSGVKGGLETRDNSASGGVSASALSRTNFPFTFGYDVSDSSVDGIQAISRFRRHAWRYFQNWRPQEGTYSANASAAQSRTTGIDGQSSAQDLGFGISSGFGEGHAVSWNTSYATSTSASGQQNDSLASYFTHAFSLEYYYRVTNTARYGELSSSALVVDTAVTPATEFRDAQVFNSVMWIPSDDHPLVLNSGLSVDWSERDGGSANSFGGSLSASYQFSEKLNGAATVSGSQTKSGETLNRLGALATSLNYTGDSREWGEYQHGWGASAGASAQKSSSGSGTGFSTSASQTLTRALQLDNGDNVMLLFSQSLSQTQTRDSAGPEARTTRYLSNSFDVTYGAGGAGEDLRAVLRLQDLRSYESTGDSVAQSVSMSADGNRTVSRYSAINASVGFGLTRAWRKEAVGVTGETGWTQSGSGVVGYRLQQPFGWRLASYEANARLNLRNDRREVDGVEENPYLYAYSIDHALTARVGLLSARLRNDFSWSETGDLVWGVAFRVARDF
jgi:hypothetical protein